jgi:flagellar protein FlaG
MNPVENRAAVAPLPDVQKLESAAPVKEQGPAASTPAATQKGTAPVSKSVEEDLRNSVAEANKRLQLTDQQMKIAIDQDTGSIVVTITDRKTGETVRQIPSEDALKLRRNLDSLTGILVDEKG